MKTKQQRFDHLFEELQNQAQINGVFLAAERGEIIYEKAIGTAELATGRPLTIDSIFDLASLSKPFTATAIILLQERGQLSYDDLVEKWLPELPYKGITIRHLLQHTSGLPDYMDLFFMYWDRSKIAANEDMLQLLIQHRPDSCFAPGENWQYSNTGYVLLAMIAAKVSGMSFPAFMKEHIFKPLEMDSSLIYNRRYRPEPINDYAYGYIHNPFTDRYELPDHVADTSFVVYMDGIQGDGVMNSTVRDLLKFDQALYTGQLISRAAAEEAFTPAEPGEGKPFDYGLGWIIEQIEGKGKVVSHTGGWPGYATVMNRYIDYNKTLIFLRNMEKDVEFDLAMIKAAENILFDEPYEVPVCPPPRAVIEADPSLYDSFAGLYRLTAQEEVTAAIEIENDHLYLQTTGSIRVELYPASKTLFFIRSAPVEVEFVNEENGAVNKLFIIQGGEKEEAVRI